MDDASIDRLFVALDTNADGRISLAEFSAGWGKFQAGVGSAGPSTEVSWLPEGWERRPLPKPDAQGHICYYIDHNTKTTHWSIPSAAELRAAAEEQLRLGKEDKAMAPGTKIQVSAGKKSKRPPFKRGPGFGDGVYVGWKYKKRPQTNEHLIRFGEEVKVLRLNGARAVEWHVVPPRMLPAPRPQPVKQSVSETLPHSAQVVGPAEVEEVDEEQEEEDDEALVRDTQQILGADRLDKLPMLLQLIYLEEEGAS